MEIVNLLQLWWVWAAAALILLTLEIFAPGFVFLGFAAGAALMAVIVALVPLPASLLLAIFAVLSLVAWFVFRQVFKLPGEKAKRFTTDIND